MLPLQMGTTISVGMVRVSRPGDPATALGLEASTVAVGLRSGITAQMEEGEECWAAQRGPRA